MVLIAVIQVSNTRTSTNVVAFVRAVRTFAVELRDGRQETGSKGEEECKHIVGGGNER